MIMVIHWSLVHTNHHNYLCTIMSVPSWNTGIPAQVVIHSPGTLNTTTRNGKCPRVSLVDHSAANSTRIHPFMVYGPWSALLPPCECPSVVPVAISSPNVTQCWLEAINPPPCVGIVSVYQTTTVAVRFRIIPSDQKVIACPSSVVAIYCPQRVR